MEQQVRNIEPVIRKEQRDNNGCKNTLLADDKVCLHPRNFQSPHPFPSLSPNTNLKTLSLRRTHSLSSHPALFARFIFYPKTHTNLSEDRQKNRESGMEHCREDFLDVLCKEYDPDCKSANGLASGTSRRSYECVFCKRGFTNARALGGHMNIHRKDRARATQAVPGPSHLIPNYSEAKLRRHNALMESQKGCNSSCFTAPKQSYSGRNCEFSCGNLSLRFELSQVENYEMRSTNEESDEIDLQLRLGQYGH